ncbi:response regulator transcription factor [Paenibacillus sp. FSL W8-1187]|uniref:response regulator transcription factor n=1 Tax=Paenibacillus sp. FSL W8-1187 TaxID=2975339 RepID=UPI0030D7B1B0
MTIKVLIADDNSFIREGMRIILSSFGDFEVVAAVEDGLQAVDYCKEHPVDVALLDIRMPGMSGTEAARLLTEGTSVKPLMLTTFDDDASVVEAVRCGAKGYLLKNNDPEQIAAAIRSVHGGHSVLQEAVLDKLRSFAAGLGAPADGAGAPADGAGAPADGRSALPTEGEKPAPGGRSKSAEGAGPASAPSAPSDAAPPDASPAAEAAPPIDRSRFTERELEVMAGIARGLSNKEISRELFLSEGTTANYITSILNKTALEHRTQIAIYYLTGKLR